MLVIRPCSNLPVGVSAGLDGVALPLREQGRSSGVVRDLLLLNKHVELVARCTSCQLRPYSLLGAALGRYSAEAAGSKGVRLNNT